MFTDDDNGKDNSESDSVSAGVIAGVVTGVLVAFFGVVVMVLSVAICKKNVPKNSNLEVCACIAYLHSLQSVFQNVSITSPNLSMLLYASNSCA